METLDFCGGWRFRRRGEENWTDVTLPHDAELREKRERNATGEGGAWFAGADYEYEKTFSLGPSYFGKTLTLEFEGVYKEARVSLNGTPLPSRPYGFTNFYADITDIVSFEKENVLAVAAKNSDQPNCRWYTGAGIIRPVKLHVQEKDRILLNGVKIRTLGLDPARVEVSAETSSDGHMEVKILDGEAEIAHGSVETADKKAVFELELSDARLWSPEEPHLYICEVRFGEDEARERFGVRTVEVNSKEGFKLNGKRVILQGGCAHSENGILGGAAFPEAERRKAYLLKKAGFNAVRCAHNPCSKAFLDACDETGLMVLDEYADMWFVHKTRYDYASALERNFGGDLVAMADKDFNHPSVVMYSLGNETAESATKRGVELFEKMKAVLKERDGTRPVTCGVNIFFNLLYRLGLGQYTDKKAEKAAEKNKKKAVGSEFYNRLAGRFGGGFMKRMATLPGCGRVTKKIFASCDVAGYNYGLERYEKDLKRHPERAIAGTESFLCDAYRSYEFAKSHEGFLGDFYWAGVDYLGEVGVGSWEYREYAPTFDKGPGWIAAGVGAADLTGDEGAEALYLKTAFELEDRPQIAVVPVNCTGERHSPAAWRFTNALPSWSFSGCEGRRAKIEVYSRAPYVRLEINGRTVGEKKFKKDCRFVFDARYESGELTAINLDCDKNEMSRTTLKSAGEETRLFVLPEKETARPGEIVFVKLLFADPCGVWKPLERGRICVSVEGGELLALGNACSYNEDGYLGNETDTYWGRALAVVRVEKDATIFATCGDMSAEARIELLREV